MGYMFSVRRVCGWWLCCLCVFFSVNTMAAKVKPKPGSNKFTYEQAATPVLNDINKHAPFRTDVNRLLNGLSVPRNSGGGTVTTVLEGEYIPTGTKGVPMKVESKWSVRKAARGAGKNLLKGGLAGLVVSEVFDQAMKGLDWVMGDGSKPQKIKYTSPQSFDSTYAYYTTEERYGYSVVSASTASEAIFKSVELGYPSAMGFSLSFKSLSCSLFVCSAVLQVTRDGQEYAEIGHSAKRFGDACPAGYMLNTELGGCYDYKLVDLDDSDITDLENFAVKNANLFPDLLKIACAGFEVNGCLDTFVISNTLSGDQKIIEGFSETTTKNITNADGTVSEEKTTTDTNYKVDYKGDTAHLSEQKTTTTEKDGVVTGIVTETTTSTDNNDEKTPEENVAPVPCDGALCEPPDYEQQFDVETKTKEEIIDNYHKTVLNAPIFEAVTGFFSVNVTGTCEVWSTTVEMGFESYTEQASLEFDYHCQPWFVNIGPWVRAVIMLVAGFLAFKVGILD